MNATPTTAYVLCGTPRTGNSRGQHTMDGSSRPCDLLQVRPVVLVMLIGTGYHR